MVNSKRMSKSKVAMIALAILLVLSLILTATGAWFSYSKSADGNTAKTVNFRAAYMTAAFTDTRGDLTVDRDKNGDGTAEIYALVASATETVYPANGLAGEILENDLMPGDVIKAKGSLTLTFRANDGEGAYYVIGYKTVTNGVEAADYTWYSSFNDGTGTAASASSLGEIKAEQTLTIIAADHQVELTGTTYNNTSLGADIVLNEFVTGDVCVRMVQKENLTKAAAYAFLVTNWNSQANGSEPLSA